MAFDTTTALSLRAQGVSVDGQFDDYLPALNRGIHLRWAPTGSAGFPRHGYYLFRRKHDPERHPPQRLSDVLTGRSTVAEGTFGPNEEYDVEYAPRANFDPLATVVDRHTLTLNDTVRAGSDGRGELAIGQHTSVRLGFDSAAFRVDVAIAIDDRKLEVRAQSGDVTLDTETVTRTGVYSLTGDDITVLEFEMTDLKKGSPDSITTVEVRRHLIADGLAEGWRPVPGAPLPISLPVAQPSYPVGPTDLDQARSDAKNRIEYGPPDRYTAASVPEPTDGTVSVTADEVIVKGTDTNWDGSLSGRTIRLDGDNTAYTIIEVLAADRLVLSRSYERSDRTDVGYVVRSDRFETIHDFLGTVVSAPGEGGMADRPYPGIVTDDGTVSIDSGTSRVDGTGTTWTQRFEGLQFRLAGRTIGSADVTQGSPIVEGSGTYWTADLEGDLFRAGDEWSLYVIQSVEDGALVLNRPYSGDGMTGSYAIYDRAARRVDSVADGTTLTLSTPHVEADVANRSYLLTATLSDAEFAGNGTGAKGGQGPATALQYPMDSLLVGSLDPAVAQLLGLYWSDETVDTDAYDYLVIADHMDVIGTGTNVRRIDLDGDGPLPASFMRSVLRTAGAPVGGGGNGRRRTRGSTYDPPVPPSQPLDGLLDGAVVLNQRRSDDKPLEPPEDPRAYDLPGATIAPNGSTASGTNSVRDTQTVAGLWWDRARSDSGTLLPDQATMFYLWRYDHSYGSPFGQPEADQFDPVSAKGPTSTPAEFLKHVEPTFLAGRGEDVPQPPPDWPDFALSAVDASAGPGWHSYAVSGVDVFGRHSGISAPAPWYDYDPEQPHDGGTGASGYAIELVDERPPPPPTNVAARTIDGDDPYIRADDESWLESQPDGTTGLFLRWEWPAEFQQQAPDFDRFEIRYLTGPLDTTDLTVANVSALGNDRFQLWTDQQAGSTPGEFVGTVLRTEGRRATVVDASVDITSGLLQLTVEADTDENGDPIAPVEGDGRLTVPPYLTQGMATLKEDIRIVDGQNTNWTDALEGETLYPAASPVGYEIEEVVSETELRLAEAYEPPATVTDGAPISYRITHPRATDRTDPDAWQGAPGNWVGTHGTVLEDQHVTRGVADEPDTYELRLPAPGTGLGDTSFEPSQTEPVVTAHLGIYAVDGDGNEGPVGAPATITNVHRERPSSPDMPVLQGEVDEATAADYHGISYYTLRWKRPPEPLSSNVFRAMDETLFREDFDRRTVGATINPGDEQLFPQELRGTSALATRESVRDELEAVWNHSDREAAMEAYRDLSPNAFRVLAGLPGNESAFTQVTTTPIERDEHPNEPGPDDPEYGGTNPQGYPDDLHAYTDELDGRCSNWYIYRAGTVDPGNNRSDRPAADGGTDIGRDLSFPGLPVSFPDVRPPRTPSVTAVEGGDREIRIQWTPVRDSDLVEYRILRTEDKSDARDRRLMSQVGTVSISSAPADQPAEQSWTDGDPPVLADTYYRVIAVDDVGNESEPGEVVVGRAFGVPRPAHPDWNVGSPDPATNDLDLAWTASDGSLRCLVQRRSPLGSRWENVSAWLSPGDYSYTDDDRLPGAEYVYRLRVMDDEGRTNDEYTEIQQ